MFWRWSDQGEAADAPAVKVFSTSEHKHEGNHEQQLQTFTEPTLYGQLSQGVIRSVL